MRNELLRSASICIGHLIVLALKKENHKKRSIKKIYLISPKDDHVVKMAAGLL